MSYLNARSKLNAEPADPLVRGDFTDGAHRFTVCASAPTKPNSFQVYANGNRADLVLIVSGLATDNLFSTWGDEWRNRSAAWRHWAREASFNVFYNGEPENPRSVRVCNG
ncbi:hypothetical protein [Glycomyces sp. NRRL B-16210]|uniref:hypothetical protein n=1 Tax=Glycomyces sp. NRRL B-16210 TaxID=1463821 RepID=UPI0004C180F9|nr:hypothetical protein [Glycomyces sp. NRRL B-16210]